MKFIHISNPRTSTAVLLRNSCVFLGVFLAFSLSLPAQIVTEVEDIIARTGKFPQLKVGEADQLSVYPNPGAGKYVLAFSDPEEKLISSQWYDLQGRPIYQTPQSSPFQANSGNAVLNAPALPAQIYIVHIWSNKAIYTKRIVKQ